MKKILYLFILLFTFSTYAQKKAKYVPMKAENWEFKQGVAEFMEYKSRASLKILTSADQVLLKGLNFSNGTIEYDFEPLDPNFTSLYFRWKDAKENECFYFRTARSGDSAAVDAIQYAPHLDGVNLWDMLFHFQSNADFKTGDWNHVKLVISGKQMRVFVNDMNLPALEIPRLEGNTMEGLLAFDGQVVISNLEVKPDDLEGLSPIHGIDPTANDSRYLRKWQVSEPITTDPGIDFNYSHVPNEATKWEKITSERRGLINLTRTFGKTEGRRIIWLKTTIHSLKAQERVLDLGFSDEVWVFINNQPLYMDKNLYGTPMMKSPDGRCSIENSSFRVPLNEGDNQLLIAVANNFYGWGIVARLDKHIDLKLEN
jgi:hypothetical protein